MVDQIRKLFSTSPTSCLLLRSLSGGEQISRLNRAIGIYGIAQSISSRYCNISRLVEKVLGIALLNLAVETPKARPAVES